MGLIISGVQPTGNLHLGNYLGAIKNWVELQDKGNLFFFIADLHAITIHQDPAELRESVMKVAALYIACGIDIEKSTIFAQSAVPGHSELAWILGCNTPLGWLNRMTQFKDKAGQDKEKAALGLYSYPVLMAADILLYNATQVPVGDDQKQHLELARDIAAAFNRNYKTEFFKIPEALIMKNGARVMSLQDYKNKMSKSDTSEYSRINLTDDNDTIRNKTKKAKTDNIAEVTYEPDTRPDVANLIDLISVLKGQAPQVIANELAGKKSSDLKVALAEALIATVEPIREKYLELMGDKEKLKIILKVGAAKANELATKNLMEVKKIVGFI